MIKLSGNLEIDRKSTQFHELENVDFYENAQDILDFIEIENKDQALKHVKEETFNEVEGDDDLTIIYSSLVLDG